MKVDITPIFAYLQDKKTHRCSRTRTTQCKSYLKFHFLLNTRSTNVNRLLIKIDSLNYSRSSVIAGENGTLNYLLADRQLFWKENPNIFVYGIGTDTVFSRKWFTSSVWKNDGTDRLLRCARHRPQSVLASVPNNQSACLQRGPVTFALLSAWDVTWFVAGQTMASSRWQWICSQRHDHLPITGWGEHYCNGITNLFTWSCFLWFFFYFPPAQEDTFLKVFWYT